MLISGRQRKAQHLNIRGRKISFCGAKEKHRRKKRNVIGEGKLFFFANEKKNGEGKEGNYLDRENVIITGQTTKQARK